MLFKNKKQKIKDADYLKQNGYPRNYNPEKAFKELFGVSLNSLYNNYDSGYCQHDEKEAKYLDGLCDTWYERKLVNPKLFDKLVNFYVYVYSNRYSNFEEFDLNSTVISSKLLPRLADLYSLMRHKGFYKKFIKYQLSYCSLISNSINMYMINIPTENNYHYFELFMTGDFYLKTKLHVHHKDTSNWLLKLFVRGSTNPKKFMYKILTEFNANSIDRYSNLLFEFFDLYGEHEFIDLMISVNENDNAYDTPIFKEYLNQCEFNRSQRIINKAATLISKSDTLEDTGKLLLLFNLPFTYHRLEEFISKFKITSDIVNINVDTLTNDEKKQCIDIACDNIKQIYINKICK